MMLADIFKINLEKFIEIIGKSIELFNTLLGINRIFYNSY